jgi:hypothetical protein
LGRRQVHEAGACSTESIVSRSNIRIRCTFGSRGFGVGSRRRAEPLNAPAFAAVRHAAMWEE